MTYFDRESEIRDGAKSFVYNELSGGDYLALDQSYKYSYANENVFICALSFGENEVMNLHYYSDGEEHRDGVLPEKFLTDIRMGSDELTRIVDDFVVTGKFRKF